MIRDFRTKRLPRLGKIRLGERAISEKSGKEYPKDLEYFVVPPEVAEKLGTDHPTELDVFLPSLDPEEFFPYHLKRYGTGGRLLCKGDGDTASCIDENTGEMVDIGCEYRDCPYYADKKCTEVGNLFVILPDVNITGVYQIDTGSRLGIQNVLNAADMFISMARTLMPNPEHARFVRLKLVREATVTQYVDPKTHKPASGTKFILNLKVPGLTYAEAKSQLPDGDREALKALPGGVEPMLGDDDRVDGELLPDPDDEMPADLYPGAAPLAATLGQKERFGDLMQELRAYGVSPTSTPRSICLNVSGQKATSIDDLTQDECNQAISAAEQLLLEKQSVVPAPTTAPAQAPALPPEENCADETQRAQFAKLLDETVELGKDRRMAEQAVCGRAKAGTMGLIELSQAEAAAAITDLSRMVAHWRKEQNTATATAPAPQPEPAPPVDARPPHDPETGEIMDGSTTAPQPALVGASADNEELSF